MATYRDIIGGLEIFAAALGEDRQLGGAEYDILLGPATGDMPTLSDATIAKLDRLGWFVSEEFCCWAHFL